MGKQLEIIKAKIATSVKGNGISRKDAQELIAGEQETAGVHYFAASYSFWAVAGTVNEVIPKLVMNHQRHEFPVSVYVYRVLADIGAHYSNNNYCPELFANSSVRVPLALRLEYKVEHSGAMELNSLIVPDDVNDFWAPGGVNHACWIRGEDCSKERE